VRASGNIRPTGEFSTDYNALRGKKKVMRCLVTGAAGFIGSHLSESLVARGLDVVGIDSFVDYYPRTIKEKNLAAVRKKKEFRFVEGNLLEVDLSELLDGVEVVFHQAAQAGVRASWGSSFRIYTDNNILFGVRRHDGSSHERILSAPPGFSLRRFKTGSRTSLRAVLQEFRHSFRIASLFYGLWRQTKTGYGLPPFLQVDIGGAPARSVRGRGTKQGFYPRG
jgi:hypothetical protein